MYIYIFQTAFTFSKLHLHFAPGVCRRLALLHPYIFVNMCNGCMSYSKQYDMLYDMHPYMTCIRYTCLEYGMHPLHMFTHMFTV